MTEQHSIDLEPTPNRAKGGSRQLPGAIVRFAGDSGDGMQVTGAQFTSTAAMLGNDLATFPDFPAEIRAPAGTLYGVSGFQIHFASHDVFTPGDRPDVLVAMNPAALKVNLPALKPSGLLVVNSGAFNENNLKKAGYTGNPLDDGSLDGFHVVCIDINKQTLAAVAGCGLTNKDANRCKNFWTLGLMYWIYSRPLEPTVRWLEKKFKKGNEAKANVAALSAGFAFGETLELYHERYIVPPATLKAGLYRNMSGNVATAWGLLAGSHLCGLPIVLGTYPITPASDILHELSRHKDLGVTTVQAEDEIAAVCVAIGASYSGKLGITTTSGPGMALKTEALGLAISTELPLVVVDVQRAGPSTGLPTKTEQADLLQAVFGRNGEAPLCVLAAATPADCFAMAVEAVRIATKYMTPVILLTDGYLANGSEPWRIPDVTTMPRFDAKRLEVPVDGFQPLLRDPETLARVWPVPGSPGLTHRIGGIEKDYDTGNISYSAANHQRMCQTRAAKIAGIARDIPPLTVTEGEDSGDLLVLGWGSTYGSIRAAVRSCRERGLRVSHAHLKYLNPLPANLGEVLGRFRRVLVPELNLGQLVKLIRSELLIPAESFPKIEGLPFTIDELEARIQKTLEV